MGKAKFDKTTVEYLRDLSESSGYSYDVVLYVFSRLGQPLKNTADVIHTAKKFKKDPKFLVDEMMDLFGSIKNKEGVSIKLKYYE